MGKSLSETYLDLNNSIFNIKGFWEKVLSETSQSESNPQWFLEAVGNWKDW